MGFLADSLPGVSGDLRQGLSNGSIECHINGVGYNMKQGFGRAVSTSAAEAGQLVLSIDIREKQ